MNWQTILGAYLVVLSGMSFVLAGFDKSIAGGNARRIRERTFYLLALAGGSPGLLLGMHIFRHKTQKASFQFVVGLILLLQVVLVYAIVRLLDDRTPTLFPEI